MSSGNASLRSHWSSGVVATIVATTLSFYLHGTRAMHLYDELNFDAWTAGQSEGRSDLYLVAIDDDSYLLDFGLTSPLDQRAVQRLIVTVADKGASVIGVDLDTRDWNPVILQEMPPHVRDKVVWARLPFGQLRDSQPGRRAQYKALLNVQPCGGSVFFSTSDAFHADQGNLTGVIRTMPRSAAFDGTLHPPFGDLVAWMSREGRGACNTEREVDAEGEYIRFLARSADQRPHVPVVSAHALLTSATGDFSGSIVLIGMMSAEAVDVVRTPFGMQSGIAVHADVVHTRLTGAPYRAWSTGRYFVLDLVLGLAIVFFSWTTRRRHGVFWLGLIGILAAAFVASLGVFELVNQYLSVWPVLLGVSLHEAVDHLAPRYWKTIWHDLLQALHRRRNARTSAEPATRSPEKESHETNMSN